MEVYLNPQEIEALMHQDSATEHDGGWQSLLVKFQKKLNMTSGSLNLNEDDLARIHKYAFDYGNGGWESTLKKVFGRTLGPTLGR